MNQKEKIAFVISRIFGPESTMPIAMWVLVTFFSDFVWTRGQLMTALSLALFVAVPVSIFMAFYILGYLSDMDATLRKQRPPVLFIKQLSLGIGLYFVFLWGTPQYIQLMVWWFLIAASEFLISFFWKVSIHMTAITMVVMTLIILGGPLYVVTAVLLPLIAWSRLVLKKHELSQLIIGTFIPIGWWGVLSLTYSFA